MHYMKQLTALVLLLLSGCGSEFETGKTYEVTVRGMGTYRVEGEDITRNSDGSWVLQSASKRGSSEGGGTVYIPATALVTVK